MKKKMLVSSLFLSASLVLGISIASPALAVEQTIVKESNPTHETYAYEATIKSLHSRVNQYRQENGLPPLKYSYNLAYLSNAYVKKIKGSSILFHENNWYIGTTVDIGNVAYAGENLAYTGNTMNQNLNGAYFFGQFRDSPAHNANLLNPNYTDVGYGVAIDSQDRVYVVQRFAGYDNNPRRLPKYHYEFDNPEDLPAFGLNKDISLSGDVRMGGTVKLDDLDEGTYTHPLPTSDIAIRWYVKGSVLNDTPLPMQLAFDAETRKGMVDFGTSTFDFSQYDKAPSWVGKEFYAQVVRTSPWSTDKKTYTFGPYIVKDVKIQNVTAPKITGTPEVGSTLSVDNGEWNRNPETVVYQWKRNGIDIPNAKSNTYKLTDSDLGQNITASVGASYQGDEAVYATTDTMKIPPKIVAPVVVNSSITGEYLPGKTLTSHISWDTNNVQNTYQWLRDGSEISGATKSTYTLTKDDINKTVSLRVIGNSVTTVNIPGNKITIPAFTLKTAPSISGEAKAGTKLSVSSGQYSNTPVSVSYQWKKDGVNISGATQSTYTTTTSDVNHVIRADITAVDEYGSTLTNSSNSTTILSSPFTVKSTPQITGKSRVGQTLSASTGTYSNNPVSFSYQWKRNGTNIPGATEATYVPVVADANQTITVSVTPTDAYGSNVTGTSTGTKITPIVSAKASISGKFTEGQTLKAQLSVNVTSKQSYEWVRDGKVVSRSSSYRLGINDVYHRVGLNIRGTTFDGQSFVSSVGSANVNSKYKVVNPISKKYTGSAKTKLGAPTGNAYKSKGGVIQNFQKGKIYYTTKTGAQIILNSSAIAKKYTSTKAQSGVLGFPRGDESKLSKGAYQSFQNGKIYWSSGSGARVVRGVFLSTWGKYKYEKGSLGYPTTDQYKSGSYTKQKFQKGYITYKKGKTHITITKK